MSTYGQKTLVFHIGNAIRHEAIHAIVKDGQPQAAAVASHAAISVRIRDIERGVDEGVLAGIRALLYLLPLLVALVALSSRLTLLAIAVLAPFALLLTKARRAARRHHSRAQKRAEELHAAVDDLVRQLDLWRTYSASFKAEAAVAIAGQEAGKSTAKAEATRASLSGLNEALAAVALLFVVLLVERGAVDLQGGSIVAFAAVFFLTYRPLRDLGDARTAVERGAMSLESLQQTIRENATNHSNDCQDRQTPWELQRLVVSSGRFFVEDAESRPLSLVAEPGEIVVILGPTGSGKTTLLRGLLGLLSLRAGSIAYGQDSLAERGVGIGQRPFAWVPQEPAIVPGTMVENVELGSPSITEREATRVLADVGGEKLLKTRANERLSAGGHELSGGERQLVALARAIASQQPVLLLDEPTAGLDPEAEQRVLEALKKQRGRKTILLVTHRPAPIEIADRVVEMSVLQDESGEIVGQTAGEKNARPPG